MNQFVQNRLFFDILSAFVLAYHFDSPLYHSLSWSVYRDNFLLIELLVQSGVSISSSKIDFRSNCPKYATCNFSVRKETFASSSVKFIDKRKKVEESIGIKKPFNLTEFHRKQTNFKSNLFATKKKIIFITIILIISSFSFLRWLSPTLF